MTRLEAVLRAQSLLARAVTSFPGLMCEIAVYQCRVTFTMYVEKDVTLGDPWVNSFISCCSHDFDYQLIELEACEVNAIEIEWRATDN